MMRKKSSQQLQSDINNPGDRNVRFLDVEQDSTHTRRRKSHSILKESRYSSISKKSRRFGSSKMLEEYPKKTNQECENCQSNQIIKNEYRRILENCSRTCQTYTDEVFPPNSSSLFPIAARQNNMPHTEHKIVWKRISELFSARNLVMWKPNNNHSRVITSSSLCPQDLVLGLNCAKNSRVLLRHIFESQKPNEYGVYYLKFFQTSVWKYIIIDDYIPVFEISKEGKSHSYRPVFSLGEITKSKAEPIEIWIYLLEKAYAKFYSSYQAILKVNLIDFLSQLTGDQQNCYDTAHPRKDWKQLFKNHNSMVVGSTSCNALHPISPPTGFSEKISFVAHGKNQKYLQKNTIWPNDIDKFFTRLYVWGELSYAYIGSCQIRQVQQTISVRSFQIKNTMPLCLSLHQKDCNFFRPSANYRYSWIRLILLEKQFNGGFRWIDGQYSNRKSLKIETKISPGVYFVLVIPDWNNKHYDLTLIIRTNKSTRLQRMAYQEGIFEEACADLAQRYGRLNQLSSFICSYNCIHEGMGIVIENVNNEKTVGEVRIRRSIGGLQADKEIVPFNQQFSKEKTLDVVIEAKHHFTVILMMKNGIDHSFFENFNFGSK